MVLCSDAASPVLLGRKPSLSVFLLLSCFVALLITVNASDRSCEPIRIETCRELGYNVTGMPNLVGHELQQDAQLQLQTFSPLIQYGCSSRLRFFLCSVFVPMCTEKVPSLIGPCRTLCEDVREKCQPVLKEFGLPWPAGLNCSKFPPQNNDKHMCMEGPADSKTDNLPYKGTRTRYRRPNVPKTIEPSSGSTANKPRNYGLCKSYRQHEQYYFINRTGRCAALCTADINFSHDNKVFANIWVSILSSLCFISTLFTLLTFLVDDTRIQYPEGAIVMISGCYNVCSLAYFVRLMAGRYETSCFMDSQYEVPVLIHEGLENVNCTITFVMLYFFGMAAAIWWVILTITLYLSAGLGWNSKVLDRYSTYFHLIAWAVPSALTIVILVMRVVDADELVGSCYVGNQSSQNLMVFVILPCLSFLSLGAIFLLLTSIKVLKRRKEPPVPQLCHPYYRAQKLDTLSVRIGIFAGLYLASAACVSASYIYEYIWRDQWIIFGTAARPNVEVFTLKIFMSLIIGFITGLWVWSSKTPILTWQKLCKRMSRRKEPLPAYLNIKPQILTCERTKKPLSKSSSETVV